MIAWLRCYPAVYQKFDDISVVVDHKDFDWCRVTFSSPEKRAQKPNLLHPLAFVS
jgi:hypothetical protein